MSPSNTSSAAQSKFDKDKEEREKGQKGKKSGKPQLGRVSSRYSRENGLWSHSSGFLFVLKCPHCVAWPDTSLSIILFIHKVEVIIRVVII